MAQGLSKPQVDVEDRAARDLGRVDIADPLPAGTNLVGKTQLRNPGDTADLGDAANPLRTDPVGATAQPVTDGGGSLTVDGTVTANAGSGTRAVAGDAAHDAVDAGNPVKLGARAVNSGVTPTAVAAGDRTNLFANRHGVQFVIGGHPNTERLTGKYTAAQSNTILKAVAAGQRFVVTAVAAYCDKGNSVNVSVAFEFDDVTDVRIAEHPGIAAGSGFVEGSGAGILAIGGDGQDVLVTCTVPTGGSVVVHVSGYLEDA